MRPRLFPPSPLPRPLYHPSLLPSHPFPRPLLHPLAHPLSIHPRSVDGAVPPDARGGWLPCLHWFLLRPGRPRANGQRRNRAPSRLEVGVISTSTPIMGPVVAVRVVVLFRNDLKTNPTTLNYHSIMSPFRPVAP